MLIEDKWIPKVALRIKNSPDAEQITIRWRIKESNMCKFKS